jgi:hypothetical protein
LRISNAARAGAADLLIDGSGAEVLEVAGSASHNA